MESSGAGEAGTFLGRLARRARESPIARGSLAVFLGNASSTAISLVKSILLARALGSDVFGLMTYALTLASFASQFIDMRTGDNIVRFVGGAVAKKENVKAATYFELGILIDLVTGFVALLAIRWIVVPIAGGHPQHETLQMLILIYMWAVPLRLAMSPFGAMLVTLRRFSILSTIQLLGRLGELASVLLLAPLGVAVLVWAMVAVAAFELLLYVACAAWLFWKRTGVWRGSDFRLAWREMRPFAVYGSLLGSLNSLTVNLDVVALGALRPASEVSFYTIARSAASVLTMAAGAVSQVIYPMLNEAWSLKNRRRVRQLIGRLVAVNGTLSTAAVAFILLTAEWLVVLFYGRDFSPAAPVLRILIVVIGLQTVTGWMRQVILIAGHPKLDLVSGILGTGFYVLFLVPFIQWRGAVGLAVLLLLDVFVMVAAFAWILSSRIRLWSTPSSTAAGPDEGGSG